MTSSLLSSPGTRTSIRASNPHPAPIMLIVLVALLLVVVLTIGWASRDWTMLHGLRLPDNDDMMRLAEVRDWLGGQAFNDLSQHRLGPPGGASMHWSRIADAIPAAIVFLLTPLVGTFDAELTMIFAYPALLFFAYLLLLSRIARRMAGDDARIPAVILGALAFPTTSLFIPGRIDHHALQIVLTLCVFDGVLARPTLRNGLIAGTATALSLAIGLETAPEIVAAMGVLGLLWVSGNSNDDRRLAGFGAAMAGVTLALLAFARPVIWPAEWCDGFTPNATRATLVLSAALVILAFAGRWVAGMKPRLAIAVPVGVLTGALAFAVAPVCFGGPYGALDPYLQHAWMSNVAEARGLFYSTGLPLTAISYGGLCFASVVVLTTMMADPTLRAKWWPLALLIGFGTIAAIAQVRVTYIMAGVATLPFAALLARGEALGGLGTRLMVWVAGCGIVWSLAAAALFSLTLPPAVAEQRKLDGLCSDGRVLRQLARMPKGVVMAPLDTGAYVIGMTPHRAVAAPYHRNNAGNLAMYRFFLSRPDRALQIAQTWSVDYVVTCPSSLDQDEVRPERPGSLIELLQAGHTTAWLRPIAGRPGDMMVYRVGPI